MGFLACSWHSGAHKGGERQARTEVKNERKLALTQNDTKNADLVRKNVNQFSCLLKKCAQVIVVLKAYDPA